MTQRNNDENLSGKFSSERVEELNLESENNIWESPKKILKPNTKIRKPPQLRNWFGNHSGESSDSASSQDESPENGWNEVQRKKIKEKKQRERKQRIKEKHAELSAKMQFMIGLGPIHDDSIDYFEKRTESKEEARELAIKEHLKHYLAYDTGGT